MGVISFFGNMIRSSRIAARSSLPLLLLATVAPPAAGDSPSQQDSAPVAEAADATGSSEQVEPGQAQDPAVRFQAALQEMAGLERAMVLIDSLGSVGDARDTVLVERRRRARLESRRNLVWELAELDTELPADSARSALVDSLLYAQATGIALDVQNLFQRSRTIPLTMPETGSLEALSNERRLGDLQRLLVDGLQAHERTLRMLTERGFDVSAEFARLDLQLRIAAEALVGRMELAAEGTASLRSRPEGAGGESADLAQEAFNTRIAETAPALETLLRQMDGRNLDTTEFRRYLVLSTGEISAENLDLRVIGGLLSSWWEEAFEWFRENGATVVLKILLFLGILAVFRVFAGLGRRIILAGLDRSTFQLSTLLRETLVRWTTRVVMLLGLLIALTQLGIDLGPLLAGLGVAGFIIGFALQDTLSNFAAGVMILLYRPFDTGDLVETGGVFGKVDDLSLVSTTILSLDNQRYVVPNSQIWGNVIKNVTAQNVRRVDLVFGIGYEDDIPKAEAILHRIVTEHPLVLEDPEPVVKLHKLGDSSVDFVVRPWCKTADYWTVFWDVTRAVKLHFDEEGVTIPFPQRDVHLHATSGVAVASTGEEAVPADPDRPTSGDHPTVSPAQARELERRARYEDPEDDPET